MSMKEAFETFFEEMTQNNIKKKGVPPTAPCNEEKFPTGLFLLETLDENGYAQWKPKLQTENESVVLKLNPLTPYTNLTEYIKSGFDNEETHYLSDSRYFLLGSYCMIDGVDSYLVQVNNETGEVTAVEVMDKRSIHLADSIEELLCNMKGIWRIK